MVGERKQQTQRSSATAHGSDATKARRGVHAAQVLSLGTDCRPKNGKSCTRIHARLPRRALLSYSMRLCALARSHAHSRAGAPPGTRCVCNRPAGYQPACYPHPATLHVGLATRRLVQRGIDRVKESTPGSGLCVLRFLPSRSVNVHCPVT